MHLNKKSGKPLERGCWKQMSAWAKWFPCHWERHMSPGVWLSHEAGPVLGARKLRSAWEEGKDRERKRQRAVWSQTSRSKFSVRVSKWRGEHFAGCILKAFEFGNQIFWEEVSIPVSPVCITCYSLLWVPDPFEKLQTLQGRAMYMRTNPHDLTYTVHLRTSSRQIRVPSPD